MQKYKYNTTLIFWMSKNAIIYVSWKFHASSWEEKV